MKRILLVEPDRVLSHTYATYIEHLGYSVSTSGDAQSAIEIADAQLFDMVILELQLQDHNGVEFLHEFRSHTDWLEIPVIIHSLLPEYELQQYAEAWRQFSISTILPKSTTTLKQLGNTIEMFI